MVPHVLLVLLLYIKKDNPHFLHNLKVHRENCYFFYLIVYTILHPNLANHIHLNIVWVDPSEIKFQIKDGDVPFVQNGDWDKNKAPFILNDAIDELYVKFPPLSIEDTQQYKLMISQIEQGLTIRGCSNKNDVLKYFKDLDILFCSLELGKYLTQNELGDHVNIPDDSRYPNEIIVSIDRFGNYLHERGGSHRLSIAKVLKLPKVPVIIIRKHLNIFIKENNHDNTF